MTQFGYDSFAARDELDFGVEFNPIFGPETLRLMFYDPLADGERCVCMHLHLSSPT